VTLRICPATADRWPDVEAIFNAKGCSVARGCWCMYYRHSGKPAPLPAGTTRAAANRAELAALTRTDPPPGLLGYRGRTPVGWISLGPRPVFKKLARSPVMKPVDATPVWSIICFVVPRAYRNQGVAHRLLEGAIAFARKRGVTLLEAYPVDRRDRVPDDAIWFGSKSMYDAAGFVEVARRKATRPVMRLRLRPASRQTRTRGTDQ
jgi:GNAT superfamily N-acetyltransferase